MNPLETYNHFDCVSKLSNGLDLKQSSKVYQLDQDKQHPLKWSIPIKQIITRRDLKVFQSSELYGELLKFIIQLSLSVQGMPNDQDVYVSNNVNRLKLLLDKLSNFIDEIPPKPKRTRFGNESFVEWFDKIQNESSNLCKELIEGSVDEGWLKENTDNHVHFYDEIAVYLTNSFGDRTRIDYGSGHELNFICVLMALMRIGFFVKEDYPALVLKIFYGYIDLMRRLQQIYWLEPAGSHGVWGLDDYHFLPFLFGSSQLIEHAHIRPKSIRNEEIVSGFANRYIYLQCIHFINKVKTGSLMEHSPMLVDISGVKNWSKVNEGMIKMYKNELLGKLPVMQHFFTGSILEFIDDPSIVDDEPPAPRQMKVHSFACCGCTDKVPSMFAMKENQSNSSSSPSNDNNTSHNHTHGNEEHDTHNHHGHDNNSPSNNNLDNNNGHVHNHSNDTNNKCCEP